MVFLLKRSLINAVLKRYIIGELGVWYALQKYRLEFRPCSTGMYSEITTYVRVALDSAGSKKYFTLEASRSEVF